VGAWAESGQHEKHAGAGSSSDDVDDGSNGVSLLYLRTTRLSVQLHDVIANSIF
jgi:hypothetical protein